MQALDFKVDNIRVNRIAVVKSVVSKFIDERPNDRIGLIAFAAAPYIVSPLTLDHDWLQQNLERVNSGIGDDGTAIGSAIAAAVNHLRTTAAKSKVVILLTDGVNNSGKIPPLAAAEAARALGVKVYTIGVGVRGKAPIPVRDEAGRTHVIMAYVDVDEKTLQAIANETGGRFYRATDTDSLQKIYEQINQYETSAQTVQKFEHVEELYRWTLFPSLALLALGCCCNIRGIAGYREIQRSPLAARGSARVPCAHRHMASLRCAAACGPRAIRRAASATQAYQLGVRGSAASFSAACSWALYCVFARRSPVRCSDITGRQSAGAAMRSCSRSIRREAC